MQSLYNKGLFDLCENKDHVFDSYLFFSDGYLFEKHGTEIKTSDGVCNLSDIGYSTREDILQSSKKDEYEDSIDLKYRLNLRNTEFSFLLFN